MNNDKLEVSRELLERACIRPGRESLAVNHADIVERGRAQAELRALLAKPAAQHQGEPVAFNPCNWTDRQVLDFLGVALRNVDLVGEVRLSEIRQGFECMRDRYPADHLRDATKMVEQPAPVAPVAPDKDEDWRMNPCKQGHRDVGAAGGIAHCYQCDEKIVAATTQEAFEHWNATHPKQ